MSVLTFNAGPPSRLESVPVPQPPVGIEIFLEDAEGIHIRWNQTSRYEVQLWDDDVEDWGDSEFVDRPQYTFKGLEVGKVHLFRLRGWSKLFGPGEWSNEMKLIPSEPPPPPAPTPEPLTFTEGTEYTRNASWDWPYDDRSSALLILQGAIGGQGGQGGGGGEGANRGAGSDGSPGNAGLVGGSSTVVVSNDTYTGPGGGGGSGGAGGAGGGRSVSGNPAGDPGCIGSTGSLPYAVTEIVTGLSKGDTFQVRIGRPGAGGGGGAGGAGGRGSEQSWNTQSGDPGAAGAAGSAGQASGRVRIVPLG